MKLFFSGHQKNVIFLGAYSDKDDWRLNFCKRIGIHPARADFQNAYSTTLATLAPPVPHVTADFAIVRFLYLLPSLKDVSYVQHVQN